MNKFYTQLALLATLIFACQKENNKPENCQAPFYEESVKFSLSNEDQGLELSRSDFKGEFNSFYMMGMLSHKKLQSLANWSEIGVKKEVFRVEMITHDIKESTIKINNLYAVLITCIKNNQYFTELFRLNNGNLDKVNGYEIVSSKYRTGFSNLLQREAVYSGFNKNNGIILLTSDKLNELRLIDKYDNYQSKYDKLETSIEQSFSNLKLSGLNGDYCPSPCYNDPDNIDCYVSQDENGTWCDGAEPICEDSNQAADLLNCQTSLSDSLITVAYNLPLHYIFRDSFLKASKTGVSYINMYYNMSYHLNGINVPLQLKENTALFLLNFNTKIDMLLNPSIYGSTILIDNNFENYLNNLLDQYELLSKNQEYLNMINTVRNDLAKYKGKTISQILSEL